MLDIHPITGVTFGNLSSPEDLPSNLQQTPRPTLSRSNKRPPAFRFSAPKKDSQLTKSGAHQSHQKPCITCPQRLAATKTSTSRLAADLLARSHAFCLRSRASLSPPASTENHFRLATKPPPTLLTARTILPSQHCKNSRKPKWKRAYHFCGRCPLLWTKPKVSLWYSGFTESADNTT